MRMRAWFVGLVWVVLTVGLGGVVGCEDDPRDLDDPNPRKDGGSAGSSAGSGGAGMGGSSGVGGSGGSAGMGGSGGSAGMGGSGGAGMGGSAGDDDAGL
jgi:hypothetical protein